MSSDIQTERSFYISGQRFPAEKPQSGLYIVATPIGNLKDITIRALEILATADVVLCEDTRHSARLFDHYGIKTPRTALHEHNERYRADSIVSQIQSGSVIALISDAGTPLLSDPGFPLVRAARQADIPVFPIPGASALLSALTGAGLPTDSFTFFGFLPPKTGQRKNALAPIANRAETMIFYESPRRLADCIVDMAEVFGPDRQAVVALEITKRFERFLTGTLSELVEQFGTDEIKGEAVIVVSGGSGELVSVGNWEDALDEALAILPLRQAVDDVAAKFSLKRKQVYNAALARKGDQE